jgi:hypothetical protein
MELWGTEKMARSEKTAGSEPEGEMKRGGCIGGKYLFYYFFR